MSSVKPRPTKPSARTAPRPPRPRRNLPWIEAGIDYGPARVALGELAAWAFDLAEKNVADCPQSRRSVKNARRFVAGALRGRRLRIREEDLSFTASLLIRIFDADLGLGLDQVITVLSELGLPTVDVPRPTTTATAMPRMPARAVMRVAPSCPGCGHPRLPPHVAV